MSVTPSADTAAGTPGMAISGLNMQRMSYEVLACLAKYSPES